MLEKKGDEAFLFCVLGRGSSGFCSWSFSGVACSDRGLRLDGALELGEVDDLDECHWCTIGLALTELDDACVAALAILGCFGDDAEELVYSLGLWKGAEGLATGVQCACLAEGDELFYVGAQCLGLGKRGGDASVEDKAACLIGEKCLAV